MSEQQLNLPFMAKETSDCWLVCEDRVKRFHYVREAIRVGVPVNGKQVVNIQPQCPCCGAPSEKLERIPSDKVYSTRDAAHNRLMECK